MTREEIAKQSLKPYEGLGRVIKLQDLYFDVDNYKEGTIITLKKATSFAGQNADEEFNPETSVDGETITVVFNCDDTVVAHKVDYSNAEEVETLSAVEGEDEYLVPARTHFEVSYVSNENDIRDMGYCEVDIYQLDEDEYNEDKADGANETFDI